MGAAETLAAVVHVLAVCGQDVDAATRHAVGLGGDTDTVAAITGGILGCRDTRGDVSWLGQVRVPDADELDRLAAGLRTVEELLHVLPVVAPLAGWRTKKARRRSWPSARPWRGPPRRGNQGCMLLACQPHLTRLIVSIRIDT